MHKFTHLEVIELEFKPAHSSSIELLFITTNGKENKSIISAWNVMNESHKYTVEQKNQGTKIQTECLYLGEVKNQAK